MPEETIGHNHISDDIKITLIRQRRIRIAELYAWMLIALLPGIKPFLLIAFRIVSYRETFPDLVPSYIYAMMIMAVPFLSKMIFGAYPLEALRARISSRNLESLNMTPSVVIKRSADIGETT
ncbi:MAG TPA: hypothetical protein VN808_12850, partial [Stellaceae bacterium]|nr:hypothetical protein [Stellaceae bacterium]